MRFDDKKTKGKIDTMTTLLNYTLSISNDFHGLAATSIRHNIEPTLNEIAAQALSYSYTSKAQFCSILNSLGYETKDDDNKPTLHIYKGGEEVGTIPVQLIMQHALRENKPDDKRRRQLRAILKKYRDLSANKEELAAVYKSRKYERLIDESGAPTPMMQSYK